MSWDRRYDTEAYVYGTEPNDFLRDNEAALPAGRVLCLADGEGRNSVWLAGRGFEVTAVDSSAVGLDKGRRLAATKGVAVDFVHADLGGWDPGTDRWDAVISIFCHLPPPVRRRVHGGVVRGLRPGGVFLLEAFTPDQLGRGTGGPSVPELMVTRADLERELEGLEFRHLAEKVRDVREGTLHTGTAAVIQAIAVRI